MLVDQFYPVRSHGSVCYKKYDFVQTSINLSMVEDFILVFFAGTMSTKNSQVYRDPAETIQFSKITTFIHTNSEQQFKREQIQIDGQRKLKKK